jgi:Zn-dependent protease with chaperone function
MKIAVIVLFLATYALAYEKPPALALNDADEVAIGRVLAQQFEQEEGMRPTPQTQRFDKYLQQFGEKIALHAKRKIPYQFHFDPDPTFRSAFGLPGGQVFVGAGILAYIDTEDQLAAVLGHEIEHVDLGQCRERLVQELAKKNLTPKRFKGLKVDPFWPQTARASSWPWLLVTHRKALYGCFRRISSLASK